MLEHGSHPASCFTTLTYDDVHVPRDIEFGDLILSPRDLTLFLKKYRRRTGKFRYFACGEYGDQTLRPHYHAIIFGRDVTAHDSIQAAWQHGKVETGEFTPERAAYIAGYVVKKLNKAAMDEDHPGKPPEFRRMSRNPAIGSNAVEYLSNLHYSRPGSSVVSKSGDVGTTVRLDGQVYPLDRTLLTKVRSEVGVPLLEGDRLPKPEPPPKTEKQIQQAKKRAVIHEIRSARRAKTRTI